MWWLISRLASAKPGEAAAVEQVGFEAAPRGFGMGRTR